MIDIIIEAFTLYLTLFSMNEMIDINFDFEYVIDNLSSSPIIDIKAFRGDNY
jgi:hypothetical protein